MSVDTEAQAYVHVPSDEEIAAALREGRRVKEEVERLRDVVQSQQELLDEAWTLIDTVDGHRGGSGLDRWTWAGPEQRMVNMGRRAVEGQPPLWLTAADRWRHNYHQYLDLRRGTIENPAETAVNACAMAPGRE